MKLFDVYPINDINITHAKGSRVWDENQNEYLDLYGGHAVISIGHSHPHWINRIESQLRKIAFYSNSIKILIQEELAKKLGDVSGKKIINCFYAIQEQKPMRMPLNWHRFIPAEKNHRIQQVIPWKNFIGSCCNRQSLDCCTCQSNRPCNVSAFQ